MSDALFVQCPRCGAEPGDKCRALTSGRSTDTHTARFDAYWNGYRVVANGGHKDV